jgi:uncharacterized SAM-binding protein YcdF (DUF218 family)
VLHKIGAGAMAGALAALLASALGAWDILGVDAAYGVVGCAIFGGAVAFLGGNGALVLVNAAMLGTYLVVAFSPLAAHWSSRWVRRDAVPAGPLDAIVVLSSSILPDSGLDAVATERLLTGLELWQRHHSPPLLTTRVIATYGSRRITSDVDQGRLLDLAGARPSWTTIDSVASTRDEAAGVLRRLGPGRRIAVVTSPMHTRRACRAFETLGFYVYCVPARERSHATVNPGSPGDRLLSFRSYLYERAALLRYRWKGWA